MANATTVFAVEAGKILEFSSAVYDDNPCYRDAEIALAQGLRGIPAPPTFSQAAALFQLGPEVALPALDMRYVLHGEQEYIFYRPLIAGDRLIVERRFVGTVEKQGKRGGTMKLHTVESTFRDAVGDVVMVSRMVLVQTEGAVER